MAKKTYWEMFVDVVDQVWLTTAFSNWTTETRRIKRDINDIQKQVLSISKSFLLKSWELIVWGTVASQAEYTIPTTVDKLSTVKVTVSSRDYFPIEISYQQFQRLANTESVSDIPVYYTIDKTKLVLFPTPETSSLPIELNANIYATDLNTDPSASTDQNTDLQIKEAYQNVIFYYSLYQAFRRLEDFASADRYQADYKEMLQDYKDEVRNPTNNIVVKSGLQNFSNPNNFPILTN